MGVGWFMAVACCVGYLAIIGDGTSAIAMAIVLLAAVQVRKNGDD